MSKPAQWKCDFCPNKYATLEEATHHEEICPKSPKRKKRPPRWACDYCFNAFPSFEAASEHEKNCPQNHSAKRSRIESTTSSDTQPPQTQSVETVWVSSIIRSINNASSISKCEEIASHLDELLGQLKEKTRQKINIISKHQEELEI